MDIELAVGAMEIAEQSIRLCCFPGTAIFVPWSKRFSTVAVELQSFPAFRQNRLWLQLSCAARQTPSWIWRSCEWRSVATYQRAQYRVSRSKVCRIFYGVPAMIPRRSIDSVLLRRHATLADRKAVSKV